MSEHTQGRMTVTDTHSNFVFNVIRLGNMDTNFGSEEDARRLAAAWNACEGMPTDDIEELAACQGVMTLTVYADDILSKLNAARALLREVLEDLHYEAKDKVLVYLDACDTLEGK